MLHEVTTHNNDERDTPLRQDIQHAHDMLTMFLVKIEDRSPKEGRTQDQEVFVVAIYAQRDALCWILGHAGNAFEINMVNAIEILRQQNKTNLN